MKNKNYSNLQYPKYNPSNNPFYLIKTDFKQSNKNIDCLRKFKLYDFKNSNSKTSIFNDLEYAQREKITHVINMSGNFKEICKFSRLFNICVLDNRLQKYIADIEFNLNDDKK